MGCAQSKAAPVATEEKGEAFAIIAKLSSSVYNAKNPPTHWSDTVFLMPHEWIRAEMASLVASAAKLPDEELTEETAWKAEMFATWIAEYFVKVVHLHHENEENIYLPMMKEKGCEIPEKKIAKDHEALMKELDEIGDAAVDIVKKNGLDCAEEIKSIKDKVPTFSKDMLEHLKEEEETLPAQIKKHVTREDSDATIGKIIEAAGFEGLQTEVPGIMVATKVWATPEFYDAFEQDLPPPILKLQKEILVPNYHTYFCAMRDAPLASDKPELKRLDFSPSMLPPPPGSDEPPPAENETPQESMRRLSQTYSSHRSSKKVGSVQGSAFFEKSEEAKPETGSKTTAAPEAVPETVPETVPEPATEAAEPAKEAAEPATEVAKESKE